MHGEVDEVIEEQFVCRICKNKSFKTEGAFNNHLNSKQHKQRLKQVEALREELALDDEAEELNAAIQKSMQEQRQREREEEEEKKAAVDSDGELDSDEESVEQRKKMNKVTKGKAEVEELKDEDLEDIDVWTHKANKKNKKKKNEKNKAEKV